MDELMDKPLFEVAQMLRDGKVSSEELYSESVKKYEETENKIDAYLTTNFDKSLEFAKELDKNKSFESLISGIPVSIKDTFTTKNIRTTAASKMLEDFVPQYDATAYSRIKKAGALIMGKTNMDEFAHGFTNEYSAFKSTKNPWNIKKVPGGSSGGSAASVASRSVFLSLASENYGSIVQPSSLCGVVGMKPTYGRSSRYGIIAMASSLECPGVIAKCVEDVAIGTEVISGWDEKDATSLNTPVPNYYKNLSKDLTGKKIAIIGPILDGFQESIRKLILDASEIFKKNGAQVDFIDWYDLKMDGFIYDVMYRSEVSSNLARYDGIRFGYQPEIDGKSIDEYYFEARDKFGEHVKRQITSDPIALTGGDDDVYEMALKLRMNNRNYIDNTLSTYDVILTPSTTFVDLDLGVIQDAKWRNDNRELAKMNAPIMCPTALYGYPSISIPAGMINDMPVGMHMYGKRLDEQTVLNIAYAYQEFSGVKLLKPKI